MARVLLIEPDRPLRNFIAGILADLGHEVRQCRALGDSPELLRQDGFDVVATDLVLGKRAGLIAEAARNTRILTLTGQPFILGDDRSMGPIRLHEKPFRFDDLLTLAAAIAEPQTPALLAA